jgi:predicted nucleic acid-binding protein
MKVFVDTSALYAVLDDDEPSHIRALDTWRSLVPSVGLLTHNYVISEAMAIVGRRLGPEAVDDLVDRMLGIVETVWVDPELHAAAVEACRAGGWRVSLVDHMSFIVMRRVGIDVAFAYDQDFENAGFRLAMPGRAPRHRSSELLAPYETSMSGDSDLVGVAEIAMRSGHPVSTIQSWRRRHEGFPTPSASLASGPVWRWPSVDRWIRAEPRRLAGSVPVNPGR